MIEDLKKLLPREKEQMSSDRDEADFEDGYNQARREDYECLPAIMEYIYADLRGQIERLQKYTGGGSVETKDIRIRFCEVLSLLTPNK